MVVKRSSEGESCSGRNYAVVMRGRKKVSRLGKEQEIILNRGAEKYGSSVNGRVGLGSENRNRDERAKERGVVWGTGKGGRRRERERS